MAKKLGMLTVVWFVIVFAYIILAVSMPVITGITTSTTADLDAAHNMDNYPGTNEFINIFPYLAWFIPGAVGVAVTVWALKEGM